MGIPPRLEVPFAVIAYSFCSGSLVLVNKLILHSLPYPSLVITVQLFATLLFIYTAKCFGIIEVDPVKWKFVFPYLFYTVAFSVGVFCNMKSLSISNVETVIVFRSMAPIVVSFLDFLFLGRELPSLRSWTALTLIVLGAVGYAATDEKFQSQGLSAYAWPIAYLFTISFEMAYGKKILKSVDLKTISGPVLYTNLLGWPPMLMFAAMGNEYNRFWDDTWARVDSRFPPGSIALLLLGCVVGIGIGYSGWWCRGKVSATSFTLIGVINKCLTVLVNLLIWDQHASLKGIASLLLCLVGGTFYQQAPLRKDYLKLSSEITSTQKNEWGGDDVKNSNASDADEENVELLPSNSHEK